jgi:hypothetical protein
MRTTSLLILAALSLLVGACSPSISGTLHLVDANLQPLPPAQDSPEGSVVNMINTTSPIEQASYSVSVNAQGTFESEKGKIARGTYKVEATRIGYQTETQTVEVGRFTGAKVDFKLKKIAEGRRKSTEASKSDEDKIVNPGEVNIQPPTM